MVRCCGDRRELSRTDDFRSQHRTGAVIVSELAESAVDEDMFIGECPVGLQWDYCLQVPAGQRLFPAGFEYQGWDGNGGIAGSDQHVR